MPTITYTGSLVVTSCWCGIKLAIPNDLHDYANREEKTIYCPLGHTFIYGSTVRAELEEAQKKLHEERKRVQATRDLLAQEERSHSATRGHVTRKRKQLEKVVAGVCPVDGCKRHFKDLRRHISTKHPDYAGQS